MPDPNLPPEMDHVADLLRRTFDLPDTAPLDPALIRLMLELSHAPDEQPRASGVSPRRSASRWLSVSRIPPLLVPRRRLRAS